MKGGKGGKARKGEDPESLRTRRVVPQTPAQRPHTLDTSVGGAGGRGCERRHGRANGLPLPAHSRVGSMSCTLRGVPRRARPQAKDRVPCTILQATGALHDHAKGGRRRESCHRSTPQGAKGRCSHHSLARRAAQPAVVRRTGPLAEAVLRRSVKPSVS